MRGVEREDGRVWREKVGGCGEGYTVGKCIDTCNIVSCYNA